MNKREALEYFRTYILPHVIDKYGKDDKIAIREEWSIFTDHLCKSREITLLQYENWSNPF
jgi:hypothetical protein